MSTDYDYGVSPPTFDETYGSVHHTIVETKTSSSPEKKEIPKISFYERLNPKLIANLSKPFSVPKSLNWCIPHTSLDVNNPSGILYTKVPKTGSSVISSVLERISRLHANTTCALMYKHENRLVFGDRNKEASVMIGSLRDPIKRGISRAFFVNKENFIPKDEKIIKALKGTHSQRGVVTQGKGGFQLNYMNLDQIEKHSIREEHSDSINYKLIEHYVRNAMNNYHFIFLNERLDEGLVILKFLLNLRTSDLLYLSSKVSGGYYAWPRTTKCIKLTKGSISPEVANHVYSDEWYLENYGDYLLYSVANKSMELTIDAIGRERFNETYHNFISFRKLVETKCAPETIFPCSADGVFRKEESDKNCYWNDIGCGWPCFEQFVNHTLDK